MTDQLGGVPIFNKRGELIGEQVDLTLSPGEQRPPRRRRPAAQRPGCTRWTVDGWCTGDLVAMAGRRWVCRYCGTVQTADAVAQRPRWTAQ